MRKVLVGGGTGFVGGQLLFRLRQCGFYPVVVGREFEARDVHKRPVGTLRTYAELAKEGLPDGTEAVVSLAGANLALPFRPLDDVYKSVLRTSRIGPTRFLRRLIADTPEEKRPKVFVQASAVGIYPPSEDARYDEDSPLHDSGGDFFAELVRDWEAAGAPNIPGVRRAVVRMGLILGRSGGLVEQSFLPFYLGLGGPLGDGRQWFPWVHVDDACAIILHAIEQSHVSGVLNAVAPGICTNKEFARAFGAALGRGGVLKMPEFVVRAMFGSDRASIFLKGQHVRPTRLLNTGYEFLFKDIQTAASEFARWKTEEEQSRLKSVGQAYSSFEHNLFNEFRGMTFKD